MISFNAYVFGFFLHAFVWWASKDHSDVSWVYSLTYYVLGHTRTDGMSKSEDG